MYRPNRDNAGQCHSLSFGTMPLGGLLASRVDFLSCLSSFSSHATCDL